VGLAAGWRRARALGVGCELLLLVSGSANAIVLANDDLVSVLFTLVLPAFLLWRLGTMSPWSGAASRAGSIGS